MDQSSVVLQDLSIFTHDTTDIFSLIDHTETGAGRNALRHLFHRRPERLEDLLALQGTVRFLTAHPEIWPKQISNGTLLMVEKYFEAAAPHTQATSGLQVAFNGIFVKLFASNEYFFTKFSLTHLSDFLRGCAELTGLIGRKDLPQHLEQHLEQIVRKMDHAVVHDLLKVEKNTEYKALVKLSYKARRQLKQTFIELIGLYAQLDAWNSLAKATTRFGWTFPELGPSMPLLLEVEGLYHPLLEEPVAYDLELRQRANLLLLTGANMSGKTTFMRAVGVAALLGHIGMGVPARKMRLSFLSGIVTNMHIQDNILKGESYFFAEVQRMKLTAEKIITPLPHLVLLDELFKGTNVHDAYECTKAVIEGLLKHPNHLIILSTHLYEVAEEFENTEGMLFRYFATEISGQQFRFGYEMLPGISSDRIGYKILQQQGVLRLLDVSVNQ